MAALRFRLLWVAALAVAAAALRPGNEVPGAAAGTGVGAGVPPEAVRSATQAPPAEAPHRTKSSAEAAKTAATGPEGSAEPAKKAAAKPSESVKAPEATRSPAAAAAGSAQPAKAAPPAAAAAATPPEPARPAASKPPEAAKPTAPKPTEPAKPAATKPSESVAAKPGVPAKPAAQNVQSSAQKTAEPAKPGASKSTEPAKRKPTEPVKPTTPKPTEPVKQAAPNTAQPAAPKPGQQAAPKSAEPVTTKPSESAKSESAKPADTPKPGVPKPTEPVKPVAVKPVEPSKSSEPAKPAAQEPAKQSAGAAKPGEAAASDAQAGGASGGNDAGRAERPARILGVAPMNARSHFAMFGRLFRALAERGHHVDVISHYPSDDAPPTYRDLSVNGSIMSWDDNVDMDLIHSLNPLTDAVELWYESLDACAKVMEHPAFREALAAEGYDLVISEIFGSECLAGFAHRFGAPLVGITSSVALPWALDRMGNPDHPAYVPNYFLPYTERMGFGQRVVNTLYGWAVRRLKCLLCDRPTDALARRYFGPDLPSTAELLANTSLVLVNSHFSANQARPMVPGVVEVGGLHLRDPRPLPEELERWLAASEAGVVVFSLGTMVRVSTWAEERLAALWAALGALPQRVLLKSKDPLPRAPRNVRVQAWLPQLDVLSHPKTVAFVTHGGLMGTQEAVWAGVPMLGVPMFADQRLNLRTLAAKGVATVLEYEDMTQERLQDALRQVTQDPGMRARAAALGRLFRDRPRPPLREAVWWVEYVLRHGGAHHLRSAAADMPLHQYLLLDVAAAVLLAAAAALAFVWFALATVYRFLGFGSRRARRRLPSVSATGQRKRYTKTKQH